LQADKAFQKAKLSNVLP